MERLGLIVGMAFLILILAIFVNSCSDWSLVGAVREGFQGSTQAARVPTPPPAKQTLTGRSEPTGLTDIPELPSAPIVSLAEANSRPFQDPALDKVTLQQLTQLKRDMDGFAKNEAPHLKSNGDPAVTLPLTRFTGDYQTVKDEILVLQQNPGIQSQLTYMDLEAAAANLRFLQRTYRLYANNEMVPGAVAPLSESGTDSPNREGFNSQSARYSREGFLDTSQPITPDQLNILNQKLLVEIARLQASGTTDPVLQARVNLFTKIQQQVNTLIIRLGNGSLKASDIPIKLADYNNFLPTLGNRSAGVGGLLHSSGGGPGSIGATLSSLFNAYDVGDASGADVAVALVERYAEDILKGLSYSLTLSYTSPNDVAKQQALATVATVTNMGASAGSWTGDDTGLPPVDTNHPGTTSGSRGQFENVVREMDIAGFRGNKQTGAPAIGSGPTDWQGRPPSVAPTNAGKFDWEARATQVCENIKRSGLNPADFGCLPGGAQVSQGYSWRGHTRMICNRLQSTADPGIPEQMGCPPVGWKGWRS